MLFNSLGFIFVFLPAALAAFYSCLRFNATRRLALPSLVLASLIFYAVWSVKYAALLVLSLVINFLICRWIVFSRGANTRLTPSIAMWIGIAFNLSTLFYFKYVNFFVTTLNQVADTGLRIEHILLPLGISFYTFQKIALLVDVARGEVRPSGFWRFALFVLFFPQLISGPITHFRELAPQFDKERIGRFAAANLAIGLTLFAVGLFKKTVIADTAILYSSPVFSRAEAHGSIGFLLGWQAALCYTIQLYFDFSGYCDMAIGLARMFGIKLPLNFQSPHQALNIVDYWRRWHMTLQRFLVTYVFQPVALPITRASVDLDLGKWASFAASLVLPTMIVFTLSGLWHGAGWTFIVWGIMHGVYVTTAEAWRVLRRRRRSKSPKDRSSLAIAPFVSLLITFIAVVFSNVMFRAPDVAAAANVYKGMLGLAGVGGLGNPSLETLMPVAVIFVGLVLIFGCPNIYQIMRRCDPALDYGKWRAIPNRIPMLEFRLNATSGVIVGLLFLFGLLFILRGRSEFIYFNF